MRADNPGSATRTTLHGFILVRPSPSNVLAAQVAYLLERRIHKLWKASPAVYASKAAFVAQRVTRKEYHDDLAKAVTAVQGNDDDYDPADMLGRVLNSGM